ncbi:SagB-type dehydrogenase family enzyme [Pseudomonas lurida]|jgi:SagB-type dehydrogenase family enzyme
MCAKTKKWLSSEIFLILKEGTAYLWDYKNHAQYEISATEFDRLIKFSAGDWVRNTTDDRSIQESGVLVDAKPIDDWGWDILSKIFHIGTCHPNPPSPDNPEMYIEYAKSYLNFCKSLHKDEPVMSLTKGGQQTLLPPPDIRTIQKASLWETLLARRTCREFYDIPSSLQALATILYGTLADKKEIDYDAPVGSQKFGFRRTSPSAGGLQATEGYVWVRNVENLTPGLYHYISEQHILEYVRELPLEPISSYLCGQHWANNLAFAILFTSRFDKLWWKYPHSRAYRPMLIDVGHLSQTANLLITAEGLQPWLTGYFHDREINELLALETPAEQFIFLVGAGHGSGSSYTNETRTLIEGNR